MAGGSGKVREISLGDDFGDVVVKANGAQVKISADGSLHGLPAAANDTAANVAEQPVKVEPMNNDKKLDEKGCLRSAWEKLKAISTPLNELEALANTEIAKAFSKGDIKIP